MDLSYVCRGKQGHKVPLFLNIGAGVLTLLNAGVTARVTVQSRSSPGNRAMMNSDRQCSGKWRRWYVVFFLQAFQYFLSEFLDSACDNHAHSAYQGGGCPGFRCHVGGGADA